MNAGHHGARRPAVTVVGLALAAVAALAPGATAAAAGEPHNEQVALVNETNAQPATTKSHLNGSAQVTSDNGQFVVFSTDAALVPWDKNHASDVYLRDTGDQITILVSSRRGKAGNGDSFEPTISADGTHIAFTTTATNLTKAEDTNGDTLDVVVKNMQRDQITFVSVTSKEKQRGKNSFFPVISGNGKVVSFQTFGSYGRKDQDKREDVYARNQVTGRTTQVSLHPTGQDVRESVLNGDVSDDGTKVTFGNANLLWVRDLAAGTTTRFWQEPDQAPCTDFPIGSSGRPVISGNGKYAAWSSCASDLPGGHDFTNVYRIELATGEIELLVEGNDFSYLPSLSRTGRFLGFTSEADDLVAGDVEGNPDVFRLDARTGTVLRASQGPDGTGGNSWSGTTAAAISGDGHSLAYTSYADNLVAGDESNYEEVFVWRD